ncbi:MAG: hypothetical protein J2O48_12785, partial [Solirubrobacterales bacterium]|nr:hypothetical protein [Solirubrobacterales bacterium]
ALLIATDLPGLTLETLTRLATWPGAGSVVPLLRGEPQPLCARYGAAELEEAIRLVNRGRRAMSALLQTPGITYAEWHQPGALADVDTPAELEAFTHPSHADLPGA